MGHDVGLNLQCGASPTALHCQRLGSSSEERCYQGNLAHQSAECYCRVERPRPRHEPPVTHGPGTSSFPRLNIRGFL